LYKCLTGVTTLAGAVSLFPRSPEDPLCVGPEARASRDALPGFWTIGSSSPSSEFATRFGAPGNAIDVERVSIETDSSVVLRRLVEPHLDATIAADGLAKLPLLELPARKASPLLAIVLSGDGGWRDLDKVIAEDMQGTGISVVGWDSLRYFWSYKTPEQAARDLAAIIEAYTTRWHARRVALIGYSFGADVLPFMYARLPRDSQERVAQISLLGLSSAADFEIKVTGWIGGSHGKTALPTATALASIRPALVQCFYGEKEDDTLCPLLSQNGAETIRTAGGHHFDGHYAALARRIVAGLAARVERDPDSAR